jgi:rhodanese-related sulfurtransferase
VIRTATIQELSEARASRRVVLVDVRTPDEFSRGHIAGAVLMPLHVVPLRSTELDRTETCYVVCESGARSAQACAYLAEQGYDVRSLEGGMGAWRSAGLPVETGIQEPARR